VIVVDVDEVVAECIHLGGQLTEAGSSGELKACGQKALDELIGRGSISDDVYIDMILAKLHDELRGDSAVAQRPAAATSPNDGVCGWVLVGFPNSGTPCCTGAIGILSLQNASSPYLRAVLPES
ncbi:hypothetical protein FOZ63_023529, partial [Perkinsus olseni]